MYTNSPQLLKKFNSDNTNLLMLLRVVVTQHNLRMSLSE